MRWLALALALALPAAARPYVRTTTQTGGVGCSGAALPLAWPVLPVRYVVDAAGSADVPGTSAFEAVDASFATWAAPACTAIRFRSDGTVANVPIGYSLAGSNVNAVKWFESGWTQSAQAIAVTFATYDCSSGDIVDADILLNGEGFTFTTAPGPGLAAADVQNTVTHEVGHLLGFDHNPDPESTMYANSLLGETKKRDLTADDVAGACDVYPSGGPPPPAPPPAPPHGGGCSSAGGAPLPGLLALAALAASRRRRGVFRRGPGRSGPAPARLVPVGASAPVAEPTSRARHPWGREVHSNPETAMAMGWKKMLLSFALAAGVASPALGEEPKGPPPALERLMKLEGHWAGEARMVIEGKGYTVTYHADFRRTKDGSGLAMSEWFDSADLGAFRGENLIGYDPFTRRIRWFSVDNMGTAHEHAGDWTSETRYAMEHRGLRQGRKYVEKVSMEVQGEALAVRMVAALGGKKTEELSGTFRRAPMQSSR